MIITLEKFDRDKVTLVPTTVDISKKTFDCPDGIVIDFRNMIRFSPGTNFTSMLLQILLKADEFNRFKLATVYPNEVFIVECWRVGFIKEDML